MDWVTYYAVADWAASNLAGLAMLAHLGAGALLYRWGYGDGREAAGRKPAPAREDLA